MDEAAAGLTAPDARKKLLRETAFTWLNRLVAFRLLEERKQCYRISNSVTSHAISAIQNAFNLDLRAVSVTLV